MRVVIDTCVVIDALQSREPFYDDAKKVFLLCADLKFDGFLTTKSITDIYYLTHRQTHNDKETRGILTKLCDLFGVLDTTSLDIRKAISSDIRDFEDGVMIETALRYNLDCIVTRNIKDFSKSPVPVYTPAKLIDFFKDY